MFTCTLIFQVLPLFWNWQYSDQADKTTSTLAALQNSNCYIVHAAHVPISEPSSMLQWTIQRFLDAGLTGWKERAWKRSAMENGEKPFQCPAGLSINWGRCRREPCVPRRRRCTLRCRWRCERCCRSRVAVASAASSPVWGVWKNSNKICRPFFVDFFVFIPKQTLCLNIAANPQSSKCTVDMCKKKPLKYRYVQNKSRILVCI